MGKVLFVSHTTDFIKFNLPFIQWFKTQGWEVEYASMEEREFPENVVDYHYKVPFDRSPFGRSNFTAYRELKRIIDNGNYDLVHCHTPVGGVVARLASKAARKRKNTKVIYTGHGFHFYKGAPIQNWIIFYPVEKLMSRISDAVVTINEEDYQLAERKFHCPSYHLHGVGVNLERFHQVNADEKQALRKKYGYDEHDFILIYAAELNKNKNQEFLIKQVPQVLEMIPNAKLLLAGYGEDREKLERLIEQLHLEHVVHLLGYRNDIEKLYQMSDLGISASVREGLGMNILEEMACGLPIVASENGFLDGVQEVYANVPAREKMSQNNVEKAKKYSVESSLKQMIEIYEKVLSGGR